MAGFAGVFRSPYIFGIALFVVLIGVASTFLYFTRLRLVAAATPTLEHRSELFARIDFWIQVATLVAQAVVTSRIMRVAGVATALAVFPCLAAGGFAVLAVLPTLTVLILVSAALRAAEVGVTRPARETLFTVIHREEKYQAKPVIDTFFYRAGDAAGSQLEGSLFAWLGPGLLWVVLAGLPITAVWVALSIYLGRAQVRLSAGGS